MSLKTVRYREFKEELAESDRVLKVELDEEWIPPHKMAAFTPYDVILTLDGVHSLSQETVESLLESYALQYDEIITIEENKNGEHEVLISLS